MIEILGDDNAAFISVLQDPASPLLRIIMAQHEEASRTATDEDIRLMQNHGIHFEGRYLPKLWGEYTERFNDLSRIGRTTSAKFNKRFEEDDEYRKEMLVKADDLTTHAWSCLENMASEYGWRKDVEFPAMKRFDQEVVCHNCLGRLWKPRFESRLSNPVRSKRLQKRRKRRASCTCSVLERVETRPQENAFKVFHQELDISIEHVDMAAELGAKAKTKRPDAVVGLGITRTLRQLLPTSSAKYSPYKNAKLAYPFLVVETKAAKTKSANFGTMLRQTAFVIRDCVRMQQNLSTETGEPHQCLVWAFMILGEEWRLYAAIPKENGGVQIFDLWHGSVLFPDCALQLLLIMEYLCDWAFEDYRMSILECLAGGESNLTRLTPSGTEISSHVSELDISDLRERSLPWRSSAGPSSRIGRPASVQIERVTDIDYTESYASTSTEDEYHWQRWVTRAHNPPPWTQKATIRHANYIKLSSVNLSVPSDIGTISTFLQTWFPNLTTREAAKKLLITIQDKDMSIQLNSVRDVFAGLEKSFPVRCLIFFQSRLKTETWQVTRQILVISCSEQAIRKLAEISEIDSIHQMPPEYVIDAPGTFQKAMTWPINVAGRQSAALALMKRGLLLKRLTTNPFEFEWDVLPSIDSGSKLTTKDLGRLISKCCEPQQASTLKSTTQMKLEQRYYVALDSRDSNSPKNLDLPKFRSQGVLVKKQEDKSPGSPDFCFLVTDQNSDFKDEFALGQQLAATFDAGDKFGISREKMKFRAGDNRFVTQWISILKGELPLQTQL